jgi:hypothetical protein
MFLLDLLVAFVLALLITGILSAALGNRGPWGLWWAFLLVLLLATWAGGLWITPFGPPLWGVSWLPMLFVGLTLALLLAAAVPKPPGTREDALAQARAEAATAAAFSWFFWVSLIGLAIAILVAYLI